MKLLYVLRVFDWNESGQIYSMADTIRFCPALLAVDIYFE